MRPSLFGTEDLKKIIISQADEQRIKTGNFSEDIVQKVLTLFETQKLKEAQRRESERSDYGNTTLTPISDDELSVDFSHSSDSDDGNKAKKKDRKEKKQERIPPPAPVISNIEHKGPNSHEERPTVPEPRGPRMPLDHWHGHHRRRRPRSHWDSPPPGPEPWVRPPPILHPMYPRRPLPNIIRPGPPMENFTRDIVPPVVEISNRIGSPPLIGQLGTNELPLADPLVLEYIEQDTMRTINIDGRPREIRYYDETAVVIMNWDDPREISFQSGIRMVTFDEKENFELNFNDNYQEVVIAGHPHKIRLGAPTRELYIDGKWYECYFGGPGVGIELDGQIRVVKMEGPPPHVKIGTEKRTDLVAGKINLIINARQMVPVFLDAKPQKFDIEGKIHTLRFVDALKTVLINEVPFKVEFGGLPKPITVHDKKHFIRFSVLPRGIKPGYVNIANMEGERLVLSPKNENTTTEVPQPVENTEVPTEITILNTEPALPIMTKKKIRNTESPNVSGHNSPNHNTQLSLEDLSSIMPSPMVNPVCNNGYDVDTSIPDSQDSFPIITRPVNNNEIPGLSVENQPPPSFLPASLNINELLQKLVSTGIITSVKESSPQPQKLDEADTGIKPVLFTQPETLKV